MNTLYLGNLRLKDIVKEEYTEVIQKFLDENGYKKTAKCDDVNKAEGNFHIYDIPRQIHICGEEKVKSFHSFLVKNHLTKKAFTGMLSLVEATPSSNGK